MRMYSILFLASLWIVPTTVFAQTPISGSPTKQSAPHHTVDLTAPSTVAQLATLSLETVTVENDPLYHDTHSYRGYSLASVLKLFGIALDDDLALRFTCSDGYKSVFAIRDVDLSRGYLVSKEATLKAGFAMGVIHEGKAPLDPGPFALVWKGRYDKEEWARWPHGIFTIEADTQVRFLGRSYPTKDRTVMAGFTLFHKHCIGCHAVNMEGGVVGPELNVPKNVTEYWTKEHLFGFVTNPQDYRFKSRMVVPPIPTEAITEIYRYLRAMANEKVCSSQKECITVEADYTKGSSNTTN